jgi:hypothetical protein
VQLDNVKVTLGTNRTLLSKSTPLALLSQDADDCLRVLSGDDEIELQIYCKPMMKKTTSNKRKDAARSGAAAQLMVIIYGEFDRFDDVDAFCDDSGIFLQDPIECDRAVEYRNPHRLSSLDPEIILTSSIQLAVAFSECASASVDFLKGFENGESLPEMEQPPALCTALHKHQKQALAFMTRREQGWSLDNPAQDVWSRESCGVGAFRSATPFVVVMLFLGSYPFLGLCFLSLDIVDRHVLMLLIGILTTSMRKFIVTVRHRSVAVSSLIIWAWVNR